jgi:hypothetical protein
MIRRVLAFCFALACCGGALAQANKVERIGTLTDVRPEISAVVEDKGYRISFADSPFAEIWLAKQATGNSKSSAKSDSSGAVYSQFAKGQLVGVIRFIAPAKDFRGQEIKPGTYTMHYDLLPSDGNHMGAAAQPDFVVLVPVIEDLDPSKPISEHVLVNLGKRASGTSHPAVFSMVPADAAKDFPSESKNDDGFEVFAAKMNVGGKETPVAIVLKGQAAQ